MGEVVTGPASRAEGFESVGPSTAGPDSRRPDRVTIPDPDADCSPGMFEKVVGKFAEMAEGIGGVLSLLPPDLIPPETGRAEAA